MTRDTVVEIGVLSAPNMLEPNDLSKALLLKDVVRSGWEQSGLSKVESVAAHSWGVSLLALMLRPSELDELKVLKMAILHDLGEVIVGDITPMDAVDEQDKFNAEISALKSMLGSHSNSEELVSLWQECENRTSAEGDFVKQCDKLDMALQARIYSERFTDFDANPFLESASQAISDANLRSLAGF